MRSWVSLALEILHEMIKKVSIPLNQLKSVRWLGLLLGIGALTICFLASLAIGPADVSWQDVYHSFVQFNENATAHLIVQTVRLPRSLIAVIVGASLAVAGAIMQGITRNPLASPGILGINAGASLAVVVATFVLGSQSLNVYVWFSFAGAAVSAGLVYFLSSMARGGVNPLNLTLAGAAVAAFVSALTSGLLIVSQQTLDEIRFWLAGSLTGRELELIIPVLPYFLVGFIGAIALGKQITTLSLGEETAQGLGQKTAWVKITAGICVVLLAGISVALAGPIGFIGLIVPHMVRFRIGIDYRWILPYGAIVGAILLLVADMIARVIIQPQELPVGLIMPLLGAPLFIYLVRNRVKSS